MVFVISKNGERLMPTKRLGKVRHLLKNNKAMVIKHNPFTIQVTYDTKSYVQPMELCMDTGYEHIGLSIKSKTTEYVSGQYDMLTNEKQHHDDCRKYRRTRRNRLRYRKPRFTNTARTMASIPLEKRCFKEITTLANSVVKTVLKTMQYFMFIICCFGKTDTVTALKSLLPAVTDAIILRITKKVVCFGAKK